MQMPLMITLYLSGINSATALFQDSPAVLICPQYLSCRKSHGANSKRYSFPFRRKAISFGRSRGAGRNRKMICLNGDSSLLQRMLSNLIRNSIVHNPDGCKISVAVGCSEGTCSFSIADNGQGIGALLLDSLNHDEDISSTQEQSDGTEHGLGLKIVKQIVKVHQGEIHYFNTVPHGLSVRIELPLK